MNESTNDWMDGCVGWNGMERNGMEWNGLEWNGMDGTEWSGWNGIMGEWSQRNALPVTEGMDEQQK